MGRLRFTSIVKPLATRTTLDPLGGPIGRASLITLVSLISLITLVSLISLITLVRRTGRATRRLGRPDLVTLVSLVTLVASMTFAGCPSDDILRRLPEPALQIDRLAQREAALVDILWVIDNSGTMLDEQAALAANFDAFIEALTLCQGTGRPNDLCDFATKTCLVSRQPCNPPDYHIGVISTDTRATLDGGRLRTVGVCTETLGQPPYGNTVHYCRGDDQDCRATAGASNPEPRNSHCDMAQALTFVTPTTPNAQQAFDRIVRVGTSGSGYEQGIRAAAMALGRDTRAPQNHNAQSILCRDVKDGETCATPTENAGFLRDEASLFIVFVTDEEDSSFGEVSHMYRIFSTLKGQGNDSRVSISAITGDPDSDGPTGPAVGGCSVDGETTNAEPSTRYASLAMYSRSLARDLRSCDEARLRCDASTERCVRPVDGLLGFCLPAASCEADADCGVFECSAGNCLQCVQGACSLNQDRFFDLLARRGIFVSICKENYATILDALGVDAAGLAKKFRLTRPVDCQQSVRCCDDAPPDESTCEQTAPLCVQIDGRVIPNDRDHGWIYEPASNAIYFAGDRGVPANTTVSIAYRVPTSSPRPIDCGALLR
ncbi:MAG: hypothetical protein IPK13_21175 [Deltaproteobacteria bacterium]|nr:hypothetical protein [Deltaproteobacteria bacterium]